MKLFSVDAEVDGLYGDTLAIAAVVRQAGNTLASFQGRVDLGTVKNDWVRENVVPAIAVIAEVYASVEELEEAFWSFWMAHREDATAIAHCGAPVETGLFRRCIERDLSARQWSGPFPLHEIGTMLLMRGHDPSSVDAYLKGVGRSVPFGGTPHHPMYDAIAAAVAVESLLDPQEIGHPNWALVLGERGRSHPLIHEGGYGAHPSCYHYGWDRIVARIVETARGAPALGLGAPKYWWALAEIWKSEYVDLDKQRQIAVESTLKDVAALRERLRTAETELAAERAKPLLQRIFG